MPEVKAKTFEELNKSPVITEVTDQQGAVATNGKVTFRLPVGRAHLLHAITFTDGGVASSEAEILAEVSRVIVRVSADQKIEMTAIEAVYLAAAWNARKKPSFSGTAGTYIGNGVLPLFFAQEWLRETLNTNRTAFGMAGQTSFQVEVEFGTLVTIDGIKMHSVISPQNAELEDHLVVRKFSKTLSNVGVNDVIDLPRDPATDLHAIHICNADGSAHDITHVSLLVNNSQLIDCDLAQLLEITRNYGFYNAYHASCLSIPFTARGQNVEALPGNFQDVKLSLTLSAANTYNFLIQRRERAMTRSI